MHYIYVLRSQRSGRWYTGYSADIRKRLRRHNERRSVATRNQVPYELLYYEACQNRVDAKHREIYLKSGMGKRYLKNRLKRFLALTGQSR